MDNLLALSPTDGRYHNSTRELNKFLSESALIYYRIYTELKWLKFLAKNIYQQQPQPQFLEFKNDLKIINQTLDSLEENNIVKVKQIEKEINHDVKAVEYYLKDLLKSKGCSNITIAMIHFACTSEDINNIAYALMIKECLKQKISPLFNKNIDQLKKMSLKYKDISMLSRTHGQPASPTTLGKELAVFSKRLQTQHQDLKEIKICGKINGAVGNYNSHYVCFPHINWPEFTKNFLEEELGLWQNPLTTQIENHDWLAKFCHNIARINSICIDLCQDIWTYISLEYFTLKKIEQEVGSSTMPHKINPIDFENAEGNFGIANSLALHLATKLPTSRLQRDLSDSTSLRTLGTMIGHCFIAQKSLSKGLNKISANPKKITNDLENKWVLLAEPIQMMMRKYGINDSYEKLKELTRGNTVTQEDIKSLITTLDLPQQEKQILDSLTPLNYIGISNQQSFIEC
jgi:adenylosuccinate lyase